MVLWFGKVKERFTAERLWVQSRTEETCAAFSCIKARLGDLILSCHVEIEILDLNSFRKLVSTVKRILTFSKTKYWLKSN